MASSIMSAGMAPPALCAAAAARRRPVPRRVASKVMVTERHTLPQMKLLPGAGGLVDDPP